MNDDETVARAEQPASVGAPAPPSTAGEDRRDATHNAHRGWLRLALLPLAGLLLALVVTLAALWVWTGTQGSLATALRWAGRWTPIAAQGVQGDLRHGGTADQLTWAQGGLRVQVRGARLSWSPGALLHRTLHVRQLAAAQIVIEHQPTPVSAQPAAGPPASFALPLTVRVDALAVGELRWAGPMPIVVHDLAARYQYKSDQHTLEIGHARIETPSGNAELNASATLQAHAPLILDAALGGALNASAAPPLAVQAALRGPLTDLQITLDAQTAQVPRQQAHLQAQLAPWAAQPLPEAHGRVERLDLRTLLATLWPSAPRTAITGRFDLAPIAGSGWHAAADLTNTERSLPIERAQASLDWQGQTVTVGAFQVGGAGSQLQAHGHWQFDARQGAVEAALTAPGATLAIQGDIAPDSGAGRVKADVSDAARLLAWVRMLPGLDAALAARLPGNAQGQAHLAADWRGGWRNAQATAVQAALTVPALTVQTAADHAPIRVQDLSLNLSGTLAQARLALDGQVDQGQRQAALRLTANGGLSDAVPHSAFRANSARGLSAGKAATPRTPSTWHLSLDSLNLHAQDPRTGVWTLTANQPVVLDIQTHGTFDIGAGALTLAATGLPSDDERVRDQFPADGITSPITLAWDASRWDGRLLATSGRLTGLSLALIEGLTGQHLRAAGIDGDVALTAAWRARIGPGQPLDLHASLERTAGDLTLIANDPQTGLQTRVAAGLRAARVALDGSGNEVRAQAQWTSERAGQISVDVRTQLTSAPQGLGWAWPEAAPVAGQISARLPQMAVWSALAPPGWRLRGILAADAHIAGTRGDPQITGTLTAEHLALRSVVDGVQFGGGRLRARFDGARLIIDEFSLRGAGRRSGHATPGGTLTATGQAGWIDGRAQAQLTATLDHLRASIRADRQMTISGRVQAALDGSAITAHGRLLVDDASITLPDQSAPALDEDVVIHGSKNHAPRDPTTAQNPSPQEGLPTSRSEARGGTLLETDALVEIDLGNQFRVQGQGIDTRLTGALTLAALGPISAMPKLTGDIHTVGGQFRAYGQKLDIARGLIRFTGAVDNPALDILALRPIYDANQKAGVQVQGTALLPRVRLYADPALPDSQTLAWLLLGHAAPATGAEAAMLQSAALAMLGGREGRGLAAHFGLDELSFANTTDANGVQSASVTLGKRLSRRLYAAYQQSLSGAAGSLLIFYELSRRWQLRAQAGANAAVDLIYSVSFGAE
ncbi:MAG: translocation/assembly module TamB domain-containing protein [Burkholderiaceae bacterium]|jgi:translocation and assembly module TamB|nr:translocation/assembly module TamB domain-containing protein [Burkholderiaceae bacterium]